MGSRAHVKVLASNRKISSFYRREDKWIQNQACRFVHILCTRSSAKNKTVKERRLEYNHLIVVDRRTVVLDKPSRVFWHCKCPSS